MENLEGGMGASYGTLPGHEAAPVVGVAPAAEPAAVVPDVKPEAKEVVTPEAEGLQEQEAPSEATDTPVVLVVPEFVDAKLVTEERQGWVNDFAQLAPQIGLSGEAAQDLVNLVVDCAVTLPYSAPDQYTTAADAKDAMRQVYGEKVAGDLIAKAQKYVGSSEQLKDYLDSTGLGNDVGVLTALALAGAGWTKLSPAQAHATTKRLMSTPEYAKGEKLTLVKLHLLSRITGGEAPPSGGAEAGRAAGGAAMRANAAKQDAAKSELRELAGKKSMTEADRARWIALTKEAI